MVDTNELATAFKVNTSTVWRMVRQGVLPPAYSLTGTPLAFWRLMDLWRWYAMPLVNIIRLEHLLRSRGRIDHFGRALAA